MEWTTQKVRQTFIEFFQSKEHNFIPSSSVVPHDDPTLLFTNAGMNQFKAIFLGQIDPKNPLAKLKRVVNSQKCIRAGGKHNDLEDVGKDTYHHTFFEMLGNWSFGDYFKKEAIEWAWELLTKVYKLPKERLYATYFGGNKELGLEPDDESRQLWLQYLPKERVLPFGMKENFWEMGDTGPCGPCSEIHFDRIGERDASTLVNADDPSVIEIWNLVFMQFNRESNKALKLLPNKHVDTGMGLERITSILQNVSSNYDIDLFTPIFDEIYKYVGNNIPVYSRKVGKEDKDNIDMAYRVVADHIRTLTFAITDGAIPSNEGRGYVLRRILRRGVRYGNEILKAKNGFFSRLTSVVVKNMKYFYSELEEKESIVISILEEEEKTFAKTLTRGLEHFKKALDKAMNKKISGEDAFILYSTFGYPVDLTILMASEKGYTVDLEEYEKKMTEFKYLSRLPQQSSLDSAMQLDVDATNQLNKMKIEITDDSFKYVSEDIVATIQTIWNGKQFIEEIQGGTETIIGLILNKTNFYSESGGQIYDTGILLKENTSNQFDVENVQSYGGYVLHMGKFKSGILKSGDNVILKVNYSRRIPIMINHTSTHILNFALRKVLGMHCDQKGSLVDAEKLRFDFSHNKPMDNKEIEETEKICSEIIEKKLPIFRKAVPLSIAKTIVSIRAVFGETYPDPVTIVSIGAPIDEILKTPESEIWKNYSIEFCGGTHLSNTSEAKKFVILNESGIAKGIRRIIAWTGNQATIAFENAENFQKRLNQAKLKQGSELEKEISSLTLDMDTIPLPALQKIKFQKQLHELINSVVLQKKDLTKEAIMNAEEIIKNIKENNQKPFIVKEINVGLDRKALNLALQTLQKAFLSHIIILFSRDNKKGTVIISISKDLTNHFSAADIAKKIASICNGKGGGKPEAAQVSLENLSNFSNAILEAQSIITQKLENLNNKIEEITKKFPNSTKIED